MNIIKKTYCRIFQTVLRMALPVLPYRNPKIYDTISDITEILQKEKLIHPLLVTDQSIRKLGLTKELESILKDVTVYDKVKPNPTTDMVEEAVDIYNQNHCDCIIAFGGGSPMDLGKAVGACIARPKKSVKKMAGLLKVIKKTPVIIAIPTTAGTGSETTLASVIVDTETRHKYVMNDFVLIPSYAILDAKVIHSLPFSIAATTGLDALTHAIEAYIGRSTTKDTREDAKHAVKLIFENIIDASNHTSEEAERRMLLAAHLAGKAFTRSYVGYVHAVSHSLSGKYNLAHGLTNAILLPIVLEMYEASAYKKLAQLARYIKLVDETESDEKSAKKFIQAIYELNQTLHIPAQIKEIKEEDIALLAYYADKEANPLYPVPVLWNAAELEAIYRKAGNYDAVKQSVRETTSLFPNRGNACNLG